MSARAFAWLMVWAWLAVGCAASKTTPSTPKPTPRPDDCSGQADSGDSGRCGPKSDAPKACTVDTDCSAGQTCDKSKKVCKGPPLVADDQRPTFFRLEAQLSSAPLSRVVCTLWSTEHALRPVLEWSGRSAEELVQTVVLDGEPEQWNATCGADPFRRKEKDGVEIDWLWQGGTTELDTLTVRIAKSAGTSNQGTGPEVELALKRLQDNTQPDTKLTVAFSRSGDSEPASLQAAIPTAPGQRSFEGAQEIVAELLQIIAEIAIERAKAGAFNLIRDNLKTAACNFRHKDAKALPETCNALSALRMQDLSSAVTVLRDAVLRDLVRLATSELEELHADAKLVVSFIGKALVNAARTGALELDARQLLAEIADDWPSHCSEPTFDARCFLGLAAQLAQVCAQGGYSCSAEQVLGLAKKRIPSAVLTHVKVEHWRALRLIVTATLPRQSDNTKARVRRIVDAAFSMVRVLVQCSSDKGPSCKMLRMLEPTQQMIIALLEQELPTAIAAGTDVVTIAIGGTVNAGLTKVTRVAGTVAAYAATFKTKPSSEEERKAQFEARKQLISDLIDELTRREGRGGDQIASIGVLPGFSMGAQYLLCGETTSTGECQGSWEMSLPQLAVGLGVAYQKLPEGKQDPVGWHIGATVLDLGQFVAARNDGEISDPTWATIFSPGLQFGCLFGGPESNLFVGLDGRYAPGLFSTDGDPTDGSSGAFRASLTAAYYVPLLDLN